jgi:DNA-directed RNA polymerase subunit RPC12/RpoP
MSNVVSLADKRAEKQPHKAGMARCLNCKHEWAAVAPIGTTDLECPNCATYQGMFKGIMSTEFPQWQCVCGEWMFFIDMHGCYCAHCGERPDLDSRGSA